MSFQLEISRSFRQICDADSPQQLWDAAERVIRFLPASGADPEESLANAGAVVLYGAGRFADAVIDAWQMKGIRPRYCVDSDPSKWGHLVSAVPTLAPAVLFEDGNKPLVVIAAMITHGIEKTLDEHGIPYLYAERDGSVGFLPGHWLLNHRIEFERVYSALADDFSRKVLLAVSKARLFQRFHFPMKGNYFSVNVSSFPQYFPENVLPFSENELFIDCGAFDGDSLVEFATQMWRSNIRNWNAIAFEADQHNVRRIEATLDAYGLSGVEVINAAVGKEDRLGNAAAFHNCRSEDASGEIQVMALDTTLQKASPTMIKMDIEGDELDALAGARMTIARCKPKLAICTYHLTSHLIDIPLHLLDNHPDYKLFMRHHSPGSLWETVCYGVPG